MSSSCRSTPLAMAAMHLFVAFRFCMERRRVIRWSPSWTWPSSASWGKAFLEFILLLTRHSVLRIASNLANTVLTSVSTARTSPCNSIVLPAATVAYSAITYFISIMCTYVSRAAAFFVKQFLTRLLIYLITLQYEVPRWSQWSMCWRHHVPNGGIMEQNLRLQSWIRKLHGCHFKNMFPLLTSRIRTTHVLEYA